MKRFRATLYQIEKDGPQGKSWGNSHDVLAAIQGFSNFVAMVNPSKGKAFKAQVKRIREKWSKGKKATTTQGVIVECYKQGSKLKVRVISPGYNADWNVQFPRNLREEGARYSVEEIKETAQGGFYRASGEIKKLPR